MRPCFCGIIKGLAEQPVFGSLVAHILKNTLPGIRGCSFDRQVLADPIQVELKEVCLWNKKWKRRWDGKSPATSKRPEDLPYRERAKISAEQLRSFHQVPGVLFGVACLSLPCWLAGNPFEFTQRLPSEYVKARGWVGTDNEWGIIWMGGSPACAIFEYMDSAGGMGYGTALTPLLLMWRGSIPSPGSPPDHDHRDLDRPGCRRCSRPV
jgi:hypothetical protein